MSDVEHMRAALALATRGLGNTSPNPTVGCVIVRDGTVVGRGWTAPGGRPHAETEALRRAGNRAKGATVYVTLEPCCHWGRTPPCTKALIAAGVSRVVVALRDQDPRVNGGGIQRLRDAGIIVEEGLLSDDAARLNAGFLQRLYSKRPLVTLKLASTLDGRIATRTGESRWITSPEARRVAHALRGQHDAVLVGSGTVLADNPDLSCRLPGYAPAPLLRVVADSRVRTPPEARLFSGKGEVIIATRPGHSAEALDRLHDVGAVVLEVSALSDGGLGMAELLRCLSERGIGRLLAEGGAALAASLLRADLVDRLAWFHAPGIMGSEGLAAVADLPVEALATIPKFRRAAVTSCGPDLLSEFERA